MFGWIDLKVDEAVQELNDLHFQANFLEGNGSRPVLEGMDMVKLTDEDNMSLEVELTEEKIKDTFWYCNGNKSPGPDGFSSSFFQVCWETVKKDVV
ncbi:hypothetical protein KIW84_074810 [Lathyrus oleraceus]|uniref:Uncharacterized protein n=1 Tax=Pisum sativum TaxID=3888 RepID=A0A9D4VSE7_PEA|nr:hypothetical protein KIW84_074810 [Pisum sativum]